MPTEVEVRFTPFEDGERDAGRARAPGVRALGRRRARRGPATTRAGSSCSAASPSGRRAPSADAGWLRGAPRRPRARRASTSGSRSRTLSGALPAQPRPRLERGRGRGSSARPGRPSRRAGDVLAGPDAGPSSVPTSPPPRELADERLLVRLARLDPAARGRPELRSGNSKRTSSTGRPGRARRSDGRAGTGSVTPGSRERRRTSAAAPPTARRRSPATSTAGRRARVAERRSCGPSSGRSRSAAVGLLADEADRAGRRSTAIRSSRSAAPAKSPPQVAEPGSSGAAFVAPSRSQELELLLRVELPRREAGRVQQAPEVVARVGEVRGRGRRDAAGVDPAENRRQTGREHVRYVPTGSHRRRLARCPLA